MAAIISVKNLSKQFPALLAVNQLSFTVNEGDIYGFLGQNGAGKSTTLRMLLSLIAPTGGEIEIGGLNLRTHRKEILRNVGAVIEKPDLYKYLTAYENLQLFAKISGKKISDRHLKEQLELVGLGNRMHSKVKTFSQGMKQRLGIAVALAHDPRLIILDEPTNGLDPQGIADMRNLILYLGKSLSKTIVVSSHLLTEIELIANRMLIIDKGEKVAEGAVKDLIDPAYTLVEAELKEPGIAWQQLAATEWKAYLHTQTANTLLFQLPKDKIPELYKVLANLGLPVYSFQPKHSLEDYFLSITSPNRHVESFTN
jgi:ABC-2 type transport system ATP-binding protein